MAKRARKVLRTEVSGCLFCKADTSHEVIMTGTPRLKWIGRPSGDVRVRAVCRQCGGYRVVPLHDDHPASHSESPQAGRHAGHDVDASAG